MRAIIDAALSHGRTVLSVLLLLLVGGVYAYLTIPKESFPDVNIPIIYTVVTLEGIAPEDAVDLLVRPLETELRTIEGVEELTANAFQGGASVIMEFDAGFNADKALDDVREAVDRAKPELPVDAEEPTVQEVNFSLFPVLVVTLAGDVPERSLVRIAQSLRDDIEGIGSVLEARIAGDREQLVEVIVDPLLIRSYGLNAGDIITLFQRSNRLVAAGDLRGAQGEFPVKVPGLFENASDIYEMPVLVGQNSVIRAGDVAQVRNTFVDPDSFARVDGKPAIALEVIKRSGENVIETIERVRATVAAQQRFWPEGVEVGFQQDASVEIRSMLGDLQNNVLTAIVLVMIICVAALGLRTAGLVGVAIPGSFLIGILTISIMGLSINNVVLFALILAVGLLVDGAIVVTEYADRKMSEGIDSSQAFGLAAKRMAWPIIASTATTLAAFLPLLFWPGLVGEFMEFLPVTLTAVLVASLVMALVFVPTMGAILVRKPGTANNATLRGLAGDDGSDVRHLPGITGAYVRFLERALKRPGVVLGSAFLLLVAVISWYATHGNGIEFFPETEPRRAQILVSARGNLSIFEKDGLMREVETRIADLPGVKHSYTRTGVESRQGGTELPADVIGTIMLELREWDTRPPAKEILAQARARTADVSGVRIETRLEEAGPASGKPIEVDLTANDYDLLGPAADKLVRHLRKDSDITAVEDTRPLPGIEWELQVDRAEAAKFGVDLTAVGDGIKLITSGLIVADYRPPGADDEVDIKLRYPPEKRTLDALDEVRLETPNGSVPISTFVERVAKPKVGEISRKETKPVITVKADILPGVLANEKLQELRNWITSGATDWDPRVQVVYRGEDEDQRESQQFLSRAFLLALFIMAIILVTQFNSFYSAGLILSAVILSTIGVFIGLLVTGKPFGVVMTGVGIIALAGIVVNNNIVLIDTYDRLRKTAADGTDAILRTGAQRLRPVLLTTITTALGLLPMATGVNIDFINRAVTVGAPFTQWWSGLAVAVVFGLVFATALTLVITPSALMIKERLNRWRQRRPGAVARIPVSQSDRAAPAALPEAAE